MTFEETLYTPYMIKTDMDVRNGDIFPYWPQNTERIEIYGEQGVMYVGRHGVGWQVFGRQKNREPVIVDQMHGRFPDGVHKDNFVACDSQPQVAQRRRAERPSEHAVVPNGQHQLSSRRPKAARGGPIASSGLSRRSTANSASRSTSGGYCPMPSRPGRPTALRNFAKRRRNLAKFVQFNLRQEGRGLSSSRKTGWGVQ